MVEWKKLGEIAKRNKGIPITAGQMSELVSNNGNVRVHRRYFPQLVGTI